MDTPPTADGFISHACVALLERLDEVVDRVAAEIEAAEPAYGDRQLISGDELRRTNRENLQSLLGYLAGRTGPSTAAPLATGRRRAENGIPLPTVLRAYRIGTGVVWDELMAMTGDDPQANRELLATASDVWKLVDDYSQALTIGYQQTVAEQLRRDARAQDAALDALFGGHVDAARMRECARTLDLPPQGSFVAIAGSTGTAAEEALPGAGQALSVLGVASAWRVRVDSHIGIVALTPRFTVERLRSILAERTAGRVGISTVFTALGDAPTALRQAELAAAATPPGSHEVVRYDEALISVLLAGSPEIAETLSHTVLGPVLDLPDHDRDVLLETVRAWFTHDGEVSAVATALFCHRNTVRFRLNRLAELTGRRLATPRAATEIQLALEAHRILGNSR
ncbi:helix-turn-helix domain-containing protein [Nocardia uniformis]|uniref:Helix-turn-helix domain-containing protein n=1 Tax=Nocardia uniformis TaxID=53432 RepID=A0A849C9Y3_9NOCA|nr:helix-turn-helix domain-containing protein [Nocardia uniformis]NNH74656.1 helix-turn-helix domain-containing protein [Nocardia uniformis]